MEPSAKRRRVGEWSPTSFLDQTDDLELQREACSVLDDPDGDLAYKRAQSERKLNLAMQSIFERYGQDFDGVGDEIDMETGDIVVNNGHILSLTRGEQPEFSDSWEDDNDHDQDETDGLGDTQGVSRLDPAAQYHSMPKSPYSVQNWSNAGPPNAAGLTPPNVAFTSQQFMTFWGGSATSSFPAPVNPMGFMPAPGGFFLPFQQNPWAQSPGQRSPRRKISRPYHARRPSRPRQVSRASPSPYFPVSDQIRGWTGDYPPLESPERRVDPIASLQRSMKKKQRLTDKRATTMSPLRDRLAFSKHSSGTAIEEGSHVPSMPRRSDRTKRKTEYMGKVTWPVEFGDDEWEDDSESEEDVIEVLSDVSGEQTDGNGRRIWPEPDAVNRWDDPPPSYSEFPDNKAEIVSNSRVIPDSQEYLTSSMPTVPSQVNPTSSARPLTKPDPPAERRTRLSSQYVDNLLSDEEAPIMLHDRSKAKRQNAPCDSLTKSDIFLPQLDSKGSEVFTALDEPGSLENSTNIPEIIDLDQFESPAKPSGALCLDSRLESPIRPEAFQSIAHDTELPNNKEPIIVISSQEDSAAIRPTSPGETPQPDATCQTIHQTPSQIPIEPKHPISSLGNPDGRTPESELKVSLLSLEPSPSPSQIRGKLPEISKDAPKVETELASHQTKSPQKGNQTPQSMQTTLPILLSSRASRHQEPSKPSEHFKSAPAIQPIPLNFHTPIQRISKPLDKSSSLRRKMISIVSTRGSDEDELNVDSGSNTPRLPEAHNSKKVARAWKPSLQIAETRRTLVPAQDTATEKESAKDMERDRERDREYSVDKYKNRDKDRHRHRHMHRDRDRDRDRERHRHKHRHTDKIKIKSNDKKARAEGGPGPSSTVTSPGGTQRTCGVGSFRCGRDFCFTCL